MSSRIDTESESSISSQASEPNVENAAGMSMARALVQALAAENVQRAKAK